MANTFGTEPGDPFTPEPLLRGWCPECGRRRGADARCRNCDPWWTSPLIQSGVPVVLGVFFVVTTGSAFLRQTQKPTAAASPGGGARLVTVIVDRPAKMPQPKAPTVASAVPTMPLPPVEPNTEALRIQREGAYINSVLRAQDEAWRARQVAARNREMAIALQQRMQALAALQAQQRSARTPPVPRPEPSPSSSGAARLEQVMTEETVVVPL